MQAQDEFPQFAFAPAPEVGGRTMGAERRGQQLAFANPGLAGREEDVPTLADRHARKRSPGLVPWGVDKTWPRE